MNVVSYNIAGGRQAREQPIDFVRNVLALMERFEAQILCLQDVNLVQDSYSFNTISSLLGQVGITISYSLRSSSRDSSLRDTAMGVAILSPSSITQKSSRKKDDTCFWISVDINITQEK